MHLRFALIATLLLATVSASFMDVETAMEHRVREDKERVCGDRAAHSRQRRREDSLGGVFD